MSNAFDTYEKITEIDAPAEAVYQWHTRPGAVARLVPPWSGIRLIEAPATLVEGALTTLSVALGPSRSKWILEYRNVDPGRSFQTAQRSGPFAHWIHTHRFEPAGDRCRLIDRVEYALPATTVGRAASQWVPGRLERTFRYRHDVTREDVTAHRRYATSPRLTVAITGASGLIGRTMSSYLEAAGHRVRPVVRSTPRNNQIGWHPDSGAIDQASFEGLDAVIHLAGENVAARRWTTRQMARIRESRTTGTRLLAETLAGLERPPRILVSASAIGYYGDRGSEEIDEDTGPGEGFLADVAEEWERSTDPAADGGIRTVLTRFGVVLSPSGGALAKMLPPFRAGLGGRLGSGRQWMSWISLDDVLGGLESVLFDENLSGPVNLVGPAPVTNADFAKVLAGVLCRPALLPVPSVVLHATLGLMADDLLLASTRVVPRRLRESGYVFRHSNLETALRHVLGRAGASERPGV
ncbi:MAG: TIGR01777 family oxidoreductase [Gemmatimonadales bacterium]